MEAAWLLAVLEPEQAQLRVLLRLGQDRYYCQRCCCSGTRHRRAAGCVSGDQREPAVGGCTDADMALDRGYERSLDLAGCTLCAPLHHQATERARRCCHC